MQDFFRIQEGQEESAYQVAYASYKSVDAKSESANTKG